MVSGELTEPRIRARDVAKKEYLDRPFLTHPVDAGDALFKNSQKGLLEPEEVHLGDVLL